MAALLCGGPAGDLLELFADRRAEFAAGLIIEDLQEKFSVGVQPPAWHGAFWSELSAAFALTIATTNYDLALESVFPDIDQGFRKSAQDKPASFVRSTEWHEQRLMHLHGSVRFGYFFDEQRALFDREFKEIFLYDDPAKANASRGASSPSLAQSGESRIAGCLITGLNKPDKVLASDPYHAYYRELGRSLEACPRLLIIGYGFGDYYINTVLRRFNRWHRDARRVAIVDFVSDRQWEERLHDPELFVEGAGVIMPLSETVHLFADLHYADPWRSPDGRLVYYPSGFQRCAERSADLLRSLAE
jgi:hypothetical protein